jgi:hypothetical protein
MMTQHLATTARGSEPLRLVPERHGLQALEDALSERLDEVADRAVRRILATIPGFRRRSVGELEDLWRSVAANLRTALTLLAERRGFREDELARWHDLGRRRAQQGIALDDVMRGLRVTNTVLWEALTETALRSGAECPQEVLAHAALVWETFDRISSHVARGHQEVADAQDVRVRELGLQLLEAVRRHPDDEGEAAALARRLGLDPQASFAVAVTGCPRGAHGIPQPGIGIEHPDRTIVIVQLRSAVHAEERRAEDLLQAAGHEPLGLGVARVGLTGIQQSLQDAEMAYRAASALGEPAVRFRDSWLTCLAFEHRDQQEVLVLPAVAALRADPDLCATVDAYIAHDGSLTAAGKALHLHANTVAYRLRVLAERTGLDARSAAGSALAQVALALARAGSGGCAAADPER